MMFNRRIGWKLGVAAGLGLLLGGACATESRNAVAGRRLAAGVFQVGRIAYLPLDECSGIVASRTYPGVFWVHNDGGGGRRQTLYAISRAGELLGSHVIGGVRIEDWEDIASDEQGRLYLGDIGNNDARRQQLGVYQIAEPDPHSQNAVRVLRGWQLQFPQQPFDCEGLFIWRGYGYVVSKVFKDARACIYRFPLTDQTEPATLEYVCRLAVKSPVTGADISADGRLLGLVAKAGTYVFVIDGEPAQAGRQKPYRTKFKHDKIEGCCFVSQGLLVTAESREIFLFNDAPYHQELP